MQEACLTAVGDRAARRRGRDMLAALAELQRALLGGDAGPALARLAVLATEVPRAFDPGLDAVVSAIALRARVELARPRSGSLSSR